jgi:hypothetical protein
MADIPQPINATAAQVLAWRERVTDTSHRPHLGASLIGHACSRHLWLAFRWAKAQKFGGRLLRLFDTGRREESRVHEELRGIGCEVWADDGSSQFRFGMFGNHFGGSVDGVVQGLPEAPKKPHILEVKTHNDKSFADLLKKGVREAKPMHFAQMQAYMGLSDLDRALYYAVNKNTDAVYIERVERDPTEVARVLSRAASVIEAAEPPPRISNDPAWFECKFCHFHSQCHGTEAPEVNCRTCAHSTPLTDGDARWSCAIERRDISFERQRVGCDGHRYIPILLERIGTQTDATAGENGNATVHYATPDGGTFDNGPAPAFSSKEIAAAADKGALSDGTVKALKAEFKSARVVA